MLTTLILRAVTQDDRQLLFIWANDPTIRAMARTQGPISWINHCAWFAEKSESPETCIWIAEADGEPIGQLRLDIAGDAAEIDISVATTQRGKGHGSAMLRMLSSVHCPPGTTRVTAVVRIENTASATAFRNAGFFEAVSKIEDGFIQFSKELKNG